MTDPTSDSMSDAALEAVLASVGDHLVVPHAVVAPVVGRPPTARRSGPATRRLRLAAGVIVLAGVAGVVVEPVQDAAAQVADWLHIGSTQVQRVGPRDADPAGLPSIEDGLAPVTPAQAEAALGRPLPTVGKPALAEPDALAVLPEGGVLLGWAHGSTTLWARPTADPADVRIRKLLDELDTVEPVADLGEGAVSVRGDHVLTTPHRRLAARAVVLWIDDGLEYRLESDMAPDEMLDTARSVTAANAGHR